MTTKEIPKESESPQLPPCPPQGYPLPPYYYQTPLHEDDDILFIELFIVIWRKKLLIFLITTLFTIISIAFSLWLTPVYRSEVLLSPVTDESGGKLSGLAAQYGGLATMAGINIGGTSSNKEEAVALLKSRALTEKFIKEKNMLPELFYENWDSEKQQWNVKDKNDIPTIWKAYQKFDKEIRSVTEDKSTGLIMLAIEWKDPHLAAEWANELVLRVNEQMRTRATEDAKKSLAFLQEELKKTSSVEVQKAIFGLIESQIKTAMVANVREEYSFRIIDPPGVPDLDDKIKPRKKRIVIIASILGFLFSVMLVIIKNLYDKYNAKILLQK